MTVAHTERALRVEGGLGRARTIARSGGCPLAATEGAIRQMCEGSTGGLRERLRGSSDGTRAPRPRRWLYADDNALARFGSPGPDARPDCPCTLRSLPAWLPGTPPPATWKVVRAFSRREGKLCSYGKRRNAICDLRDLD